MPDIPALLSAIDDHGFEDTETARKLEILVDTFDDINSREPWPYLEQAANITLSQGDDTPSMPSDYAQVLHLVIPSEGAVLEPERLDTVTKKYVAQLSATGQPFLYYFLGTTVKVLFVPDRDYTALLHYQRHQPALTATSAEVEILLPPRHHRCALLGTLARLYAMEDDSEEAALFDSAYERRIKQMTYDLFKQQFDRPDRVIDLWCDDDDY